MIGVTRCDGGIFFFWGGGAMLHSFSAHLWHFLHFPKNGISAYLFEYCKCLSLFAFGQVSHMHSGIQKAAMGIYRVPVSEMYIY